MTWKLACWSWVSLPILGLIPGAPVRLSALWLSLAASMVVLGLGLVAPRQTGQRPIFGALLLAALGLAVCQWRQPTGAFLWAWQASVLLSAAGVLAVHGEVRWLQQGVLGCAWGQVGVLGLQALHIPLPWPFFSDGMVGTLGSIRPVSILVGLAALWATGWAAWVFSAVGCLTGSGTVVPIVLLRRWWPYRTSRARWMIGFGLVGASVALVPRWSLALTERWEAWTTWPMSWWGHGLRPFPGGFQDDTPFGWAMHWKDFHNVALDWVGRFGLPGFLVLLGMGWWVWRRKPDPWTLAFVLWVGCWQSLEQFPVLVIPFLVWLIELSEGGKNRCRF